MTTTGHIDIYELAKDMEAGGWAAAAPAIRKLQSELDDAYAKVLRDKETINALIDERDALRAEVEALLAEVDRLKAALLEKIDHDHALYVRRP